MVEGEIGARCVAAREAREARAPGGRRQERGRGGCCRGHGGHRLCFAAKTPTKPTTEPKQAKGLGNR